MNDVTRVPAATRPFGDFEDVAAMAKISPRSARELMKRPDAPRRIILGPNLRRFDMREVGDWLTGLPRELQIPSEPDQLQRGRVYRSGRLQQQGR